MSDADPASDSGLVVRDVRKTFPTADSELTILTGVDVTLSSGESLAITGDSGSGKSTLLYIIGTLMEPSSGSVRLLGSDPFVMSTAEQTRFRNAHIGFVFQDHHLLPQCTVLENVLLPTIPTEQDADEARTRAEGLLEKVGLKERLHHRPARISGGERQRVAVCRALMNKPGIVLADEPTGNLDWKRAEEVGSVLLDLCSDEGVILVCVTHSRELAGRFGTHHELEAGHLSDATADQTS